MLNNCEICGTTSKVSYNRDSIQIYFCEKCQHYYCSELNSSIQYDVYEYYEDSLKQLRIRNFSKIINKMMRILPTGAVGLEVGSALGWFLQESSKAGYSMCGIEPISTNYEKSIKEDMYSVINGYFPQDLPEKYLGSFDFIIFNDVFEHIPNLQNLIIRCRDYLKDDGYLIINLPMNTGIMYRVASVFAKLGNFHTLERLWQLETESPHLHYFSPTSLKKSTKIAGFLPIFEFSLDTVDLNIKNLYARVSGIGKSSKLKSAVLTCGIMASVPLMKIMPKDIKCFVFKKEKE